VFEPLECTAHILVRGPSGSLRLRNSAFLPICPGQAGGVGPSATRQSGEIPRHRGTERQASQCGGAEPVAAEPAAHAFTRSGAGAGSDRQADRDAPTAPMTWMKRLRRVFAIDLSICPDFGGRLRVIADVTRPDIIERILEHVARQHAPPEFSASSGSLTVH
jgi:hypothetical protein